MSGPKLGLLSIWLDDGTTQRVPCTIENSWYEPATASLNFSLSADRRDQLEAKEERPSQTVDAEPSPDTEMSDRSERIAKDIKRDFKSLTSQRCPPGAIPFDLAAPVLGSILDAIAFAIARETR